MTGEPLEAARAAQLLLAHGPYDPESLRLCCRALQAADQTPLLERVYRSSCTHFLEVGERLPAHWQAFLAEDAGSVMAP